ncbi:2-dehydro-3-deoxygalactonokinase [Shimia marina]|uniref:2-keto-3-deoxy-galactonokinase n=1 Tax=Shimia marina TaxID=321267 RepID=A0A0P1FE33_9RHOB|nr:2-dehydro-3-deoxygalactonokinase [Shimia marina]CUH52342.1 2-keto-3-deoxy-galactonokinase [Shimia marina]SFE09268.1 2-keto-3-deoxygalactonate kinase [Shimia marina]
MSLKAEWIAVAWGRSMVRAWAMNDGEVIAQAQSDAGPACLTAEAFEEALLALIFGWLSDAPTDVVICGMEGAPQGWVDVRYGAVPCPALAEQLQALPCKDARLRVYLVPGMKQTQPADVMRGEETQMAGFLSQNQNWDGVICLPGLHTKWAHVSADEVVSFRSFMTGEMFKLLTQQSVLRHSVGEGWNAEAFQAGLDMTLSRPESLASELFSIRAGDLLLGTSTDVATARLSGLLLGAELAASRPYWLGQQIAVIGESSLAGVYAEALKTQGAWVEVVDGDAMTRAGLQAARAQVI